MDNESFESKIKRELRTLNFIQRRHFAWYCGVSALPFLGAKGNFDFWDVSIRQKHIYAIFYALDCSRGKAYATYTAAGFAAASAAARDANYSGTHTAGYAANAAAYAAHAADARYDADAIDAASNAAMNALNAANTCSMDLEPLILSYITSVKSLNKSQKNYSTDWYKDIWDKFQAALENEGCAYWENLYLRIINNGLSVDENALEKRLSIPIEIREQGASEVAHYIKEIETKGASWLDEARIIILGEKGAGKTCLARRLVNSKAPMTTPDESTAGVDTTLWKLDKEGINVRIWDFAGHTVTHAVHQFFLSERCLYIIVYDGRTEERNRLIYWLDHMKNYGGDSRAVILINERDRHSVDIPINTLKEKAM